MDNFQNRHEEFLKLIDKTSKVLEGGLRDGKITQYEYDELKSLDIEYDKEKDPINLYRLN